MARVWATKRIRRNPYPTASVAGLGSPGAGRARRIDAHPRPASDMREHAVERARYAAEIKRLDKRRREPDLPVVQEAAELFLGAPSAMRELLLIGAKRSQYPVRGEDCLHARGAKTTDQLVLQIRLADVEAEPFHVGAAEIGTEAGPLESTPQLALLARVAEAGDPHARPSRGVQAQEPVERLRAPHRQHRNALGHEIPPAPSREGVERNLVTDTFDEHDCTRSLDPASLTTEQAAPRPPTSLQRGSTRPSV
jgi:hypothetical protein